MPRHLLACGLVLVAACGGSKSGNNPDGNNGSGSDGSNGNGDSLSGNPTTVTVTLVDHPNNAAMYTFLAAYQDGAAAWTAAPTPTGDTYTFTINAPVWGFAWTCIVPGTTTARVELAYFAVSEKTSLTETVPIGCTDRAKNVGVSGTVTNLPGGGGFGAWFAQRGPIAVTRGATGDTFTMEADSGPHDLFITQGGGGGTGALAVTDVAVVRGVTAPTTTAAVDWSTSKGTTNATSVTFSQTTNTTVTTTLFSAGGTPVTMAIETVAPFTTVGLDASLAASGDVYEVRSTVRGNGGAAIVAKWMSTLANDTYTAPTPLGGATSSVPTTMPYPEILTSWNAYANASGYVWDITQGGGNVSATNVGWTAILGPGYVGGMPKFEMPDLSALAGWSTSFQLATGQAVAGTSLAYVSSAGAADFPVSNPAPAGTTRTSVTSAWTVTP